jgi:hypothetical protein
MIPSVAAAGFVMALVAPAQAPESRPAASVQRALGEVTAVDATAGHIRLKTDTGEPLTVRTDDKTAFLRAQPGARDLAGATPTTLAEIAVGDRLLARGTLIAAEQAIAARQVVVMARGDITKKHEQDEADWRRRGVSGVVTAVDPGGQAITVEVRSLAGARPLTVSTAEGKPTFKRYAAESVRFSDARPSSFAEIKPGDQVRVLGERSPDGSKMVAEQVVSGAFQILSGAVKSVDGRSLTIVDNETSKPVVVALSEEALVRRLPPEMAARLATRTRGAGGEGGARGGPPGGWQGRRAGGGGRPEHGGQRPPSGPPEEGGRAGTLHDMLERLPALPVDQLQPGDQVAVSSAKGADNSRVTAFVVLAGIEPLLESRPSGAAGGGETLGLAAGALDAGLGVP